MLSKKLAQAINDQMNFELYSGHVYVAMSAWCAANDLPGFANWFVVQEQEERFHGMKFFGFLTEMDERPILTGMPDPKNEYESLTEVFEAALDHEKEVTSRIYNLMDIAHDEREYRTISLLNWFIDEQREEEDTVSGLLAVIRRIESKGSEIYQLDKEAATRVFTPPTTA
ncbi:ferritin [Clostridium sp. 'deep sea']|uniref:ferritin n=1 Tax=Clostridium sp. 'deep sea' TaxID=2779445 RepID=UPI0018964E66|nr:ferritin [Clostridium sp. 'deep sea']QOR34365.1 ferritin [Clostridium sp. 'deep sea']